MEALAPGRAPRGRRRAGAAGSAFSALSVLFSAFLLRAPPAVGYFARLPRSFRLTQDSLKIVGSSHFPGNVLLPETSVPYLSQNQVKRPGGSVKKLERICHAPSKESTCAMCNPTTEKYRTGRPIIPMAGAKGKIISENSTAQVTSTGSLIFQNFEEGMSGVYTCFLEYKPTVEEIVRNLQLKYIVYAYREPHFYYQFTARYHAAPCNSIYNISFEKKLLQILSKLVLDLSCEVSLLKSECHRVKMQRAGLQNELFFTFSVSSIDPDKGPKSCGENSCESTKRLSKAKNLIERFFNQQVEVLGKRIEPLPEIYYIEGTLQMIWIDRCFPGYGMNTLKHPKCPECCVICSPGSYNPRDGTHCLQCNSSMVFGRRRARRTAPCV